jgi:hypothetical protein
VDEPPIGTTLCPEGKGSIVMFSEPAFNIFSHSGINKSFRTLDNINDEIVHISKYKKLGCLTEFYYKNGILYHDELNLEPITNIIALKQKTQPFGWVFIYL